MKQKALLAEMKTLPDQPLLIRPPRKKLLTLLTGQWVFLFLLILLSFHIILFFVSVPLFSVLVYQYARLTRMWKVYRYSRALLHGMTCLVWISCFWLTYVIRSGIQIWFTL